MSVFPGLRLACIFSRLTDIRRTKSQRGGRSLTRHFGRSYKSSQFFQGLVLVGSQVFLSLEIVDKANGELNARRPNIVRRFWLGFSGKQNIPEAIPSFWWGPRPAILKDAGKGILRYLALVSAPDMLSNIRNVSHRHDTILVLLPLMLEERASK